MGKKRLLQTQNTEEKTPMSDRIPGMVHPKSVSTKTNETRATLDQQKGTVRFRKLVEGSNKKALGKELETYIGLAAKDKAFGVGLWGYIVIHHVPSGKLT